MKEEKALTEFDKKAIFEKKCMPLLNEVKTICAVEGLPIYYTVCVANGENESVYMTDGFLTGSNDIHLKDDRFKKHLLVGLGFDVVPKREDDMVIQMDSPDAI